MYVYEVEQVIQLLQVNKCIKLRLLKVNFIRYNYVL